MKIRAFLLFLITTVGIVSCKKDNFNYPAGTVGISKIIYFPIISTNGSKTQVFVQGTPFTDSGATAILNGAAVTYTTSQAITSTTAPGVYEVTYTAANPQGYTASDWRIVVVVDPAQAADPTVIANNFSGTYLRAATGVTSTWTKIGPGVYTVENVGGAASGVGLLGIAENPSGNNIVIPVQPSPYYGGSISTSNEGPSMGGVPGTPVPISSGPTATYLWEFNATGYGTGIRTFVLQ